MPGSCSPGLKRVFETRVTVANDWSCQAELSLSLRNQDFWTVGLVRREVKALGETSWKKIMLTVGLRVLMEDMMAEMRSEGLGPVASTFQVTRTNSDCDGNLGCGWEVDVGGSRGLV